MTNFIPSQDAVTDRTSRQFGAHDVTPEVASLRAARRLMSSAVGYAGPQEAQRLALVEALAVLNETLPPYPPLPPAMPVASATDLNELTQLVLEHLRVALEEIGDINELSRVATASIVLRRGGGVAA